MNVREKEVSGARIFLSYKRGHAESERLLHAIGAELAGTGYEVLIDETMQGGDRWPTHLYQWLLDCAGAVVLASPDAKTSDWCQREWHVLAARAEASGVRVVPVCIGLSRDELGPLQNLQSIELAPDTDLLRQVTEALAGIEPWRITPRDYLALHQAWNRYQFESEPVLGRESFTLEQIYVETECGVMRWGEISSGRTVLCDPFDERNGGRASLVETVASFILNSTFRDAIVVQGPAGAGKSAFTLRLAKELEARGLHAVRIRFRDMRLAIHDSVPEMLADAVRIGPESDERPAPASDLFDEALLRDMVPIQDGRISRWVFVLDGWDEVSLAGSAGYQAQLRTWLPRIGEFFKRVGAPVRLIVTGRPSIELKESGFLHQGTPVLTLRPMRPEQLEWLGAQIEAHADWSDLFGCSTIFRKYEQWFKHRDDSGVEMVGLPLLALLTFRTLSSWEGDVDQLIASPTALYRALIDQTVAHSGKARSEDLQGTVQRGGPGLRHLLQRTAAMISLFWSERITFTELQARLEEMGDLAGWVDSATQGHPLHELVVNFYFKGGHQDLGCEFLHKSFREYLFAEAIVAELERLAGSSEGPLDPPPLEDWKDFDEGSVWHRASRGISKLFASSSLTPEVRRHLFWLIGRAVGERPRRWTFLRDLLADVYGWWAEGVHLRPQPRRDRGKVIWEAPYVVELVKWVLPYTDDRAEPKRTATVDGCVGYALIQLTAWVHSLRRGSQERAVKQRRYQRPVSGQNVRFCPGNGYLQPIMARWATVLMPFALDLVLPDVWLQNERIPKVNFLGADLSRANLSSAILIGASFVEADLRDADLRRADLTDADLLDAFLGGAMFEEAQLDDARLDRTGLREAPEDGVDFADMSDSNLQE